MKVTFLTLTIVVVANCRPDGSHLPSGSYLPISGQSEDFESKYIGGASGYGGISGNEGFQGFQNFGNQDQRHVYFYAAPDDQQYTRLRINIIPNSQRNTKIIFVKAPSHGGVIPEIVAPPSISEDKTLVYVLVKKPEQDGSINIPASLGIRQSKPQVFFIKYNNKQEAAAQINGGLQEQPVGSKVPDVSEGTFVQTFSSGNHHSLGASHGGFESHNEPEGFPTHGSGSGKHGPPGASGPY